MKVRRPPAFDTDRLIEDVKAKRATVLKRHQSQRALAEASGIYFTTVASHLGSNPPKHLSADHALQWMLWLGRYDIREYVKEPE